MKGYGGYFELELNKGHEFYTKAIALNTGRNALEYILRAKKTTKLILPYYNSHTILEPIRKLNIPYQFYHIDCSLNPILNIDISKNDTLLYVNYYGIKQDTVRVLVKKFSNIIIDNAQAFYCPPLHDIDTFYSPRKFFGIPDGAYLFTDTYLDYKLDQDTSLNRIGHLLKRIEFEPEKGYKDYKDNEISLQGQPIKKMSKLTQALLKNINYLKIKKVREKNFYFLHKNLERMNKLKIELINNMGPMVYPFFIEKESLKDWLNENKIYVATYWSNVLDWVTTKDLEAKLTKFLIPLPVDQRYGEKDLIKIVSLIKSKLR